MWEEAEKYGYLKLDFKFTGPGLKTNKASIIISPFCLFKISLNGSAPVRIKNNDDINVKEIDLGTPNLNEWLNHLPINLISPGSKKDKLDRKD
jgi:hypothetical protein